MSEGCWQIQIIGEAAARAALRAALERCAGRRYRITEAGSAAGVDRSPPASGADPLVVLLAHGPPGLDAPAELAALRGRCSLPAAPVVVCAPRAAGRELERSALRAGALEVLAEGDPAPAALERAIERAVDRFEILRGCAEEARERDALEQRTAKALRESERFRRSMLDNLFAFAGVLALDGTLLEANRAPLEAAGIDIEDVRGRKFWDCPWWSYSEDVREEVRAACERAVRGEIVRYDTTIRVAGDSRMRIDFQLSPLRDEDGRVTHLIPSAIDITERKRAEAELLESEERLRKMVEASPFPAMIHAEGGRVLVVNTAWTRLSGYSPDEISTIDAWTSRAYGERGPAMKAHIEREVHPIDQPVSEGEYVIRTAAGPSRVWEFFSAPVGREREGRRLVLSTAVDVTERTRAEDALRESEARFRALADNMSQLAWMSDGDGWVFWYNQRWIEYTGTTLEEMRSVGWPRVHHPDHVDRVVARIRRCFETGEPWEDTFPLRGKDGQYRWFLSRARPIRDDAGRLIWWIGTHTDITAQREAEETLRQAVKLRDEFLSVASHELRTPLTALSLQLEGLKRQIERQPAIEGARVVRKVETALRQSGRLATLIEGLLSVSRIIAGRFQLELEPFDLTDVVHDTVERVTEIATRAGCEIRVAPGGPVVGTWDRSRLDQVLMNLLTNAIKYGAGHPVDVEAEAPGDAVELRVRDHGIGISEADQPRIFGRFERAVPSTHYGGLGLGLYISREIVEAHGGTIHVESTPGSGSTFIVRLPRVARPPDRGERHPRS